MWFSDDERRYLVQVKSKFAGFSLTLTLQSVAAGELAAAPSEPSAAMSP